MSRAKYVHFLVCKLPNSVSIIDSLHNYRLHFYFKICSLKDISNFRYSNKQIIAFFNSPIRAMLKYCHRLEGQQEGLLFDAYICNKELQF